MIAIPSDVLSLFPKKRLNLKSIYKERYMEIKQATLQDLDALMTVFERANLI